MVGHAGGKHQSRVIAPVQSVQPRRHPGQEAGAPFGLPVGGQRPASRDSLSPQVHHVQEVVIEEESEDLAEAEQGQVSWVLGLNHPENLKAGKVPLIDPEVGAADDVPAVKLQTGLQADAAVLRHRQGLQTFTVYFSA